MTLPAAPCRRALQRRITSPTDSVWISDGALAAAFARYCLVSKTWHRRISSVPGPLESRRRLGKRQLGDLSIFRHSAAPPPWALSGLIDFTQWQWEPPQSPSVLEKNQSAGMDKSAVSIANFVPEWLKELAADITDDRLPPPPDLYTTPIPRDQLFRAELDRYLQMISTAPLDMVTADSRGLFHTLQQSISLGDIPPSELSSIPGDIWDALVERLGDSAVGYQLYRSLCSALVAGITNSKVFRPDFVDAAFWDTLLMRLAELPPNDESCDVFHQILAATSPGSHRALEPGILAFLGQCFAAWRSMQPVETTMAMPESSRPRHQVQQIAKALAAINPEYHDSLVTSANHLAFQTALASRSGQGTMEYSWLSVLAQMPLVRQEVLFDMVARLSAHGPLAATDLCSLLIAQWISRGYLTVKAAGRYESLCAANNDTALASLALAVFAGNCKLKKAEIRGLYASLWRLLKKLGRVDDMVKSLEVLSHNRRVPRKLVAVLFVASGDHHVALRLHSLYNEHLRRRGGPEWNPALFRKLAVTIVRDPSLPPGTIWKALDIDPLVKRQQYPRARRARHEGTYGAQRAAVVRELADVFGDTADAQYQRNPRLAFRQVSQCVRFLEEAVDVVPPSVVTALYRVVTKDLVDGRPGRTTRLNWFLSVVERNHGSHISQQCRLALRGWRYRLKQLQHYRRRGGGTDEKP